MGQPDNQQIDRPPWFHYTGLGVAESHQLRKALALLVLYVLVFLVVPGYLERLDGGRTNLRTIFLSAVMVAYAVWISMRQPRQLKVAVGIAIFAITLGCVGGYGLAHPALNTLQHYGWLSFLLVLIYVLILGKLAPKGAPPMTPRL